MPTRGRSRRFFSLWLGPLVGLAGLVSYFAFFARWAPTPEVLWVNLPLVGAGVGMSLGVLWHRRTAWSFVALAVSVICATVLVFHVFVLSAQPPDPGEVVPVGTPVPRLISPEHGERQVRLDDSGGGQRELACYRGVALGDVVRRRSLTAASPVGARPEVVAATSAVEAAQR